MSSPSCEQLNWNSQDVKFCPRNWILTIAWFTQRSVEEVGHTIQADPHF